MNIIARFRSPLKEKFGLPRQAGLSAHLKGTVVLEEGFRRPEALKGLEGFDYIWLIWGFHLNPERTDNSLTVRPPRLGGNATMGVFATRSPFRPNPLGLSSVKVEYIDKDKGTILVSGADLADGTPIYDIKPYIAYTDSHPDAKSGFVSENKWDTLEVHIPSEISQKLGSDRTEALKEILAQDPRPRYQDDPSRNYGVLFDGLDIHFRVEDRDLFVTEAV